MRTLLDLAIERIYAAGIGDLSWAEALAAVTRALDTDRAMLFTPELPPHDGGLSVSHDASGIESVPPFLRNETQWAGRPPDDVFSLILPDGGDATMPTTLFVLVSTRSAPRTPEERRAVDVLSAHLSMAARVWFRHRVTAHGAEALASSLNAAALITDPDGSIVWMNHRANTWVQGARLVLSNGRVASIPGLKFELAHAIREAAEKRVPASAALASEGVIEIVPVPMPRANREAGAGGKAALVILRDRSGCRQAGAALAANYRLTSTEIDLAIALWKGILLGEYAAQRSVAMSTVRTQLKSLLAKTGSRRQSDVVSLVARMQPTVGNPALSTTGVLVDTPQRDNPAKGRRDTSNGG